MAAEKAAAVAAAQEEAAEEVAATAGTMSVMCVVPPLSEVPPDPPLPKIQVCVCGLCVCLPFPSPALLRVFHLSAQHPFFTRRLRGKYKPSSASREYTSRRADLAPSCSRAGRPTATT